MGSFRFLRKAQDVLTVKQGFLLMQTLNKVVYYG